MKYILTPEEMKAVDYETIVKLRVTERQLLEAAGLQAFSILTRRFPDIRHRTILVLCGKGNNGGDGLVLSRYLAAAGAKVDVVYFADEASLRQDNISNLKSLRQYLSVNASLRILEADGFFPDTVKTHQYDIIVDALFGIGYKKTDHPEGVRRHEPNNAFLPYIAEATLEKNTAPATAPSLEINPTVPVYQEVIEWVNLKREKDRATVVSLDIPSGLDGKNGTSHHSAIFADLTIAFGFCKTGYFFGDGPLHTGEIELATLPIPEQLLPKDALIHYDWDDIASKLPKRAKLGNKTTGGKLLIVAGHSTSNDSQCGALILCIKAALASGVSYIAAAVPESRFSLIHSVAPEVVLMNQDIEHVCAKLPWADAVVIGPGWGRSADRVSEMKRLLHAITTVTRAEKKFLLDADALFAMSEDHEVWKKMSSNILLTPHAGEWSRLTNEATGSISANTQEILKQWSEKCRTPILLKGKSTVIWDQLHRILITEGNEVLSTAGTGDILSGVIGGLSAQGLSLIEAASAGALFVGKAAMKFGKECRYPSANKIVSGLEMVFAEMS